MGHRHGNGHIAWILHAMIFFCFTFYCLPEASTTEVTLAIQAGKWWWSHEQQAHGGRDEGNKWASSLGSSLINTQADWSRIQCWAPDMTPLLEKTTSNLWKAYYRGLLFSHKDQWFVPLGINTIWLFSLPCFFFLFVCFLFFCFKQTLRTTIQGLPQVLPTDKESPKIPLSKEQAHTPKKTSHSVNSKQA